MGYVGSFKTYFMVIDLLSWTGIFNDKIVIHQNDKDQTKIFPYLDRLSSKASESSGIECLLNLILQIPLIFG